MLSAFYSFEDPSYLKSFHSTTLFGGKNGMTGRSMSLSSNRLPLRMREGKNSDFRFVFRCSGVKSLVTKR